MTSRKIPESAVENLVSDLEGKANVANTVTTNTNQTITSSKNLKTGGTNGYSRPFQIFMPTSTESNPTEDKTREIAFLSSDGTGNNYEGSLTHSRFTDGTSYTGLRTGRLVNGTYTEASIGAKVAADGTRFGTAPTTPNNASGNIIVTANYLKNKYVDLNTNQAITGQKVFTTEPLRRSTVIDITTQPEKYTSNNGFKFVDKNGNIMGFLENSQQADGRIRTGIHAKNKDGYQPNIGVYAPLSGTTGAYATAPNTPDNAPANAIVTKDKIANMVTTNTAQTISGVKTFNSGTLQALRPILLKENNANEGGQIHFERSNNSVLKDNPYVDLLINTIRFIGINSNNTVNITLQVDLQNKQVLVPTPALTANDTQAATTAWVNSKMKVVSALPAAPDANVFYFIPE